jgi:hypothetical protein
MHGRSIVRGCALTGRLAFCALIGPLMLAATLPAQTLPVPALPPQEPPQAGTTGQKAGTTTVEPPAEARPRPWEYGLGVGVGYDSNIDFRVPDGPSSLALSPRANLARVFRSPKGQLRLGGAGFWIGYPDEKDLGRYNADFSLAGSYRSSPGTTWRANASYGLGYSDTSRVLGDQGVLLPLVPTRTTAGGLGVTSTLGPRTSLRIDGRIFVTMFDQADIDTLGLTKGQSLRGTAGLERKLGTRDTAAIEYSLESVLGREVPGAASGDRYYLTHYGSFQWTHLFSARSGFLLEAGASYTPQPDEAGLERQENFYGGASYSRQVKRSSIVLFARREVAPAFGLGVSRVEDRLGLNATIPMGRSWRLRVAGAHVMPETPAGSNYSYGTPDEASAVLAWRLGRYFEISGEGRYRRRGAAGNYPEIEAYQAGLFLSLVNPN